MRVQAIERRLLVIGCLALYVGFAAAGMMLANGTPPLPPWNPGIAFVVALLLLRGFVALPFLVIGAAASAILSGPMLGSLLDETVRKSIEILVYAGAAWLLRQKLRIDIDLRSFEDVFRFVAVASLSAAVMAGLYAVSLLIHGIPSTGLLVPTLRYWLGDMIGVSVICPLLLIHRRRLLDLGSLRALATWEVLGQAISILLVLFLIFPRTVGSRFFPMFIPLVWVAARYGISGVVVALTAIQLSFVAAVAVLGLPAHQVVKLQILMLSLTLTGLFLGAVISERERARALVIEGVARLKAMIDMAPDGMMIVDEAGRIEMVNRQFENLCADAAPNIVGRSLESILQADTAQGAEQTMLRQRDGTLIAVESSRSALTIQGQQSLVVAIRDITARKQAEADLGRRRSQIERASRGSLTGELAAAMAHELNQPLAAIVYYTAASERLLRTNGDIPLTLDQIAKASAQAERAGKIIGRLREVFCNAAIEAAPVPLYEMTRQVLQLLTEEIVQAEASVEIAIPEDLVADVDKLQIEQVIVNLLRNSLDAMAGTRARERAVRITALPDGDKIQLSLTDTGSGIAPDVSSRLFTPFTTTRRFGMGLGLSISRSIIEAHGGQLWLDETSGAGTTLSFTVPRHQPHGLA